MKKTLLFFSLLFLFKITQSQVVFCPPGAEWHYNFRTFFSQSNYSNEQIKYTGDTVVFNENVKKLSHRRFFKQGNIGNNGARPKTTYIKQSGDTIFMKNANTSNSWQILYNFNCQIGQSWFNTFVDESTTPVHNYVKVDSMDYVTINGKNLKRLHVTYDNDAYGVWGSGSYGEIIERIGFTNFLFNYNCHEVISDDDWWTDFLCYQDDTLGLKPFSSKPCDFTGYTSVKEESLNKEMLSLYPNPSSGKLTVEFSDGVLISLTIINSVGQIVCAEKDIKSNQELNISFLSKGVYTVKAQLGSNQIISKLVME